MTGARAFPLSTLVVVAREYEAEAVLRLASDRASRGCEFGYELTTGWFGERSFTVVVADVGPIAATMATMAGLQALEECSAVLSAGIAGAFVGSDLDVGDVVAGTQIHHADFGAEQGEHFIPGQQLEWPNGSFDCCHRLVGHIAEVADVRSGELLTVTRQSTSPDRIAALQTAWPDALAEAMEGIGVASVADRHELPMTEIRAISNMVGPRELYPWDKPAALDSLAEIFSRLGQAPIHPTRRAAARPAK